MMTLALFVALQVDPAAALEPGAALEPANIVVIAGDTVVHTHRRGVCLHDQNEACGPAVVSRDVHTLRAASLSTGKERWRETDTPAMIGALRNEAHVLVAVVAANLAGTRFAVLDIESGRARATCALDGDGAGDGAGGSAWASMSSASLHVESKALLVRRHTQTRGGHEPPPVPSLLVHASLDQCSVMLLTDPPSGTTTNAILPSNATLGGSGAKGHVEVVAGAKKRRFVIDEQPRCPAHHCIPIP